MPRVAAFCGAGAVHPHTDANARGTHANYLGFVDNGGYLIIDHAMDFHTSVWVMKESSEFHPSLLEDWRFHPSSLLELVPLLSGPFVPWSLHRGLSDGFRVLVFEDTSQEVSVLKRILDKLNDPLQNHDPLQKLEIEAQLADLSDNPPARIVDLPSELYEAVLTHGKCLGSLTHGLLELKQRTVFGAPLFDAEEAKQDPMLYNLPQKAADLTPFSLKDLLAQAAAHPWEPPTPETRYEYLGGPRSKYTLHEFRGWKHVHWWEGPLNVRRFHVFGCPYAARQTPPCPLSLRTYTHQNEKCAP